MFQYSINSGHVHICDYVEVSPLVLFNYVLQCDVANQLFCNFNYICLLFALCVISPNLYFQRYFKIFIDDDDNDYVFIGNNYLLITKRFEIDIQHCLLSYNFIVNN